LCVALLCFSLSLSLFFFIFFFKDVERFIVYPEMHIQQMIAIQLEKFHSNPLHVKLDCAGYGYSMLYVQVYCLHCLYKWVYTVYCIGY
jgi:hypothetical protein